MKESTDNNEKNTGSAIAEKAAISAAGPDKGFESHEGCGIDISPLTVTGPETKPCKGRFRKAVRKTALILAITLVTELVLLACVEYIYLPNRNTFRVIEADLSGIDLKERDLRLPDGAVSPDCSFNGAFFSYISENNLCLTDSASSKVIKRIGPGNNKFVMYRWLIDREMVIFAGTVLKGSGLDVIVGTCEAVTGIERYYPAIAQLPKDAKVLDILVSALTNVVYVIIRLNDSEMGVYRFDIMDKLSCVMVLNTEVPIFEMQYADIIVYTKGDGETKKLRYLTGKTARAATIKVGGSFGLLGLDADDRIYVGRLDNEGFVTEILYAGLQDFKEGKTDKADVVDGVLKPENLLVSPDSKLYSVKETGTLTAILHFVSDPPSGEGPASILDSLKADSGAGIYTYKGSLIHVGDGFYVYCDDNTIKLRLIDDQD